MAELFEEFPYREDNFIIIRKMQESDLTDLTELTENEKIYRYIPPLLFKKSKGNLLAAIRNLGGRDFDNGVCNAGEYIFGKGSIEKWFS